MFDKHNCTHISENISAYYTRTRPHTHVPLPFALILEVSNVFLNAMFTEENSINMRFTDCVWFVISIYLKIENLSKSIWLLFYIFNFFTLL